MGSNRKNSGWLIGQQPLDASADMAVMHDWRMSVLTRAALARGNGWATGEVMGKWCRLTRLTWPSW